MTLTLKKRIPVDNHSLLTSLCNEGLKKKNLEQNKQYLERLNYELGVIKNLKFTDYFLIVYEIVNGAKQIGVKVGPGRGSAAGSLVVYLLGITSLDPVKYSLLFERMLNPSRASLPDIDLDFSNRNKVLELIKNKFGKNKVCAIGTWGYYQVKSALDDASRVLGLPHEDCATLKKRIPIDIESLEDAYRTPEVQTFIEEYGKKYNDTKIIPEVFEFAKVLEGRIRHLGTHAAGVVISDKPIGTELPLWKIESTDDTVSQWDKDIIDSLGYLKIDILGLSNLTIIQDTIKLIGKEIDIDALDLMDQKVYDEFGKGNTVGIFQLENPETIGILKAIKVTKFSDIYNITSVIRPGLDREGYIDNHNHPTKVKYLIPQLEDILIETYGILLYQEQVMQITIKCAGFTPIESDNIRKIIAKDQGKDIGKWEKKFIDGCINNKISEANSRKLWESIYNCRSYLFNKSHACAYSFISYQTMWLKTHYPLQFLTSCLNMFNDVKYVKEAERLGIKVLPPDVNKSKEEYEIEDGNIRIGLKFIKHLGATAKNVITNAPYENFSDFLGKCSVRRNGLVCLVQSGAFDTLEDRGKLLGRLTRTIELLEEKQGTNLVSVFENTTDFKVVEKLEYLKHEKDVIGFYISEDPVERFKEKLKGTEFDSTVNKKNIKLGGLITAVKVHKASSGNMAFIKLLSLRDEFECVIWPSVFKFHGSKIQVGNVVKGNGARTDKGNYSLESFEILR